MRRHAEVCFLANLDCVINGFMHDCCQSNTNITQTETYNVGNMCMVSSTASPTCAAQWCNLMPTANVGNTLLIHCVYINWKCHKSLSVSVQHATRMQGNTANFAHAMLANTCTMWKKGGRPRSIFHHPVYTTKVLKPRCAHCLRLIMLCFYTKKQTTKKIINARPNFGYFFRLTAGCFLILSALGARQSRI